MVALGFVAFVAAGIRWWVAYRRRPVADVGKGTEGLLQVAYSAKNYVLVLRRLTILNGVLLFFVGVFGLTAANYYMEGLYYWSPAPLWNEALMVVLWLTFFVLMAVWVMHYRVVSREHRRIVSETARPPLDL